MPDFASVFLSENNSSIRPTKLQNTLGFFCLGQGVVFNPYFNTSNVGKDKNQNPNS